MILFCIRGWDEKRKTLNDIYKCDDRISLWLKYIVIFPRTEWDNRPAEHGTRSWPQRTAGGLTSDNTLPCITSHHYNTTILEYSNCSSCSAALTIREITNRTIRVHSLYSNSWYGADLRWTARVEALTCGKHLPQKTCQRLAVTIRCRAADELPSQASNQWVSCEGFLAAVRVASMWRPATEKLLFVSK